MTPDLEVVLGDAIPNDHARQVTAEQLVLNAISCIPSPLSVLDLGCGDGRAAKYFDRFAPRVTYRGIDIEQSPEVLSRTDGDSRMDTFNGVDLPYPDDVFDIIYSRQVFEHVRYPENLLKEIMRCLKPGGRFIGSTSFLESYHSFSIFGYSPYGLWIILSDAGFNSITLRPGIDGVTLVARSFFKRKKLFKRFLTKESPFNRLVDWRGRRKRWSPRRTNAEKLAYAGHLIFDVSKPIVRHGENDEVST